MSDNRHYWIWVFGEIQGLRWVLERDVMAFAEHTKNRVRAMRRGDLACLYVTRDAFHNPPRDRAYLAGLVELTSLPRHEERVSIAEMDFCIFAKFKPIYLFPEHAGPTMSLLAPRLRMVKHPDQWGQYFRRSPVEISKEDFRVLEQAILSHRMVREKPTPTTSG